MACRGSSRGGTARMAGNGKGLPNFSIVESERTVHTLIDVKPDNI
jgi:hypothetical protein